MSALEGIIKKCAISWRFYKKKTLKIALEGLIKLAATYFPTWYSSIIGTNGLNFSVRYGKRWIPIVITTIVFLSYGIYSIHTTVFYINERETFRLSIARLPIAWQLALRD